MYIILRVKYKTTKKWGRYKVLTMFTQLNKNSSQYKKLKMYIVIPCIISFLKSEEGTVKRPRKQKCNKKYLINPKEDRNEEYMNAKEIKNKTGDLNQLLSIASYIVNVNELNIPFKNKSDQILTRQNYTIFTKNIP